MADTSIPTHLAALEALERTVKILAQRYDAELVDLFSLDPTTRKTTGGLYLPPVARWYRQPEPSRTSAPDQQHRVAGYVGQIGPITRAGWSNITGAGFVARSLIPFGIGIYFLDAPSAAQTCPTQGVTLGPDEVLLQRAYCYLGALRHTLVKYGCFDRAMLDVTPNADMGLGGSIESREVNGDDRSLMGIVLLEILIAQDEVFPAHTALPAPPTPTP